MLPGRRVASVLLLLAVLAGGTSRAETPDADATLDGASLEKVQHVSQQARKSVVVITVPDRDGTQQQLGTGFVVSAEGLIATNLHVVGEGRPISVQMSDGTMLKVTAVHASDRLMDLALLEVDKGRVELAELALAPEDESLASGAPVVVMGNPFGLKYSVVSGVTSGVREVDGRRMLQLAMPIEPGNSGGPVLDLQGRVHGIVTMKSLVTRNLGFAVDVRELRALMERPNPVAMSRWLTIGALDSSQWKTLFGARWQQRAGRILVSGAGEGFGGRSLCLAQQPLPELPVEVAVWVRLKDEAGAAGLVFHSDGADKHYGFYPSNGKLRLSRFDGPNVFTWNVLWEQPSEHYHAGQWNHLKVRIENDKLTCFVNDHQVLESRDRGFTSGAVGLAKFRDTEAEFKQFLVAAQVPLSQLPDEVVQQLNQAIDKLPPLESLDDDQLAPLAENAAAGAAVLLDRADKLEQQAAQLRQLASDVHVRGVVSELQRMIQTNGDEFDLLRAALLVAKIDDRELEVDDYVEHVERMAGDIKHGLPADADEPARLAALQRYLFQDNGYHGSRFDFYHQANSYLNRVIDDRVGIPITLSVLYMELGRRLNLKIEGLALPGHFIVRFVPAEGEPQLIDVYNEAKVMSREDADRLVRGFTGEPLADEHLEPAARKSIVLRMLLNLRGIAERKPDREALLRYLDAALAIEPQLISERGIRAMLRYETGRTQGAVDDMDWFLEHKPVGLDLDRIREFREVFRNRSR